MKKIVLTILSMLMLLLSSILIIHIVTNEVDKNSLTIDGEDITVDNISNEINNVLLDEDDEIMIGEMV